MSAKLQFAQGSYGKFKIKVPGQNFQTSNQVHAFIYNSKGQILKQFAKVSQSGYSTLMVGNPTDEFTLELLPTDTKNAHPEKYFCDVQVFNTIGGTVRPLMNPSYKDENIIFELQKSIAKNEAEA